MRGKRRCRRSRRIGSTDVADVLGFRLSSGKLQWGDGGRRAPGRDASAGCYLQTADGAETAQTTAQAAPSARGGRQGRKGLVGNGQGEREVRGATWAVGGGTWQVIARVKHHRAERRCGLKGAGGRQRGACWVLSGGRAERCGVGGQGTGSAAVGSMWWWVACSARRLVLWSPAFCCRQSSHMVGGSVSGVSGF